MHAVTIGGSASAGNVIANVIAAGYFVDLSNSSLSNYAHNNSSCGRRPRRRAWLPCYAQQNPSAELPTSFLIDHNRFKATGSFEDGIWILDLGPPFGMGKKLVVGSGGGKPTSSDEGINNKVVGLNYMHCDGPGKDVRDIMKHKMEHIRSWDKH